VHPAPVQEHCHTNDARRREQAEMRPGSGKNLLHTAS
jgi:hypothetical protein